EPNKNLRTLEGMKSNYGEVGGKIDLLWQDGVFRPINGLSGLDKLAAEQKANDVFLALLGKFEREARTVSPNPGSNYAPAIFSKHSDAMGLSKEKLRAAMDRLLAEGKIKVKTFGPPSRERTRLASNGCSNDA